MLEQDRLKIVVVVDSREQNPLRFTLPTERGTLVTGDYSIRGLERYISIERKSVDDLVACLKNGQRVQFEKELSRGKGLDYFALVVETDLAGLAGGRYRSEMIPKAVIQSLMAFSIRYKLPIFFCADRKCAAEVVESLLEKYVAEILKRTKALSTSKEGLKCLTRT